MEKLKLAAICLLIIYSCSKEKPLSTSDGSSLISEAKNFVDRKLSTPGNGETGTIRSSLLQKANYKGNLSWSSAYTTRFAGKPAVIIPIQTTVPFLVKANFTGRNELSSDDVQYLLVYRNSKDEFVGELITLLPDSTYLNKRQSIFSGFVNIEDLDGNMLNRYKIEAGGKVKKFIPATSASKRSAGEVISTAIPPAQAVTVCYYLSGYNYAPSTGLYYEWTEFLGCETSYIYDTGNDYSSGGEYSGGDYLNAVGGGGGVTISPAKSLIIPQGGNTISNVADYNKCFTNVPGSGYIYEVSLCVQQPKPGTRTSWNFTSGGTSPIFVGHSFLIFRQTTPTRTVIRNIGFYPATSVTPTSPISDGRLNNDAQREFNISLTISMTSSQFFAVLDHIERINRDNVRYNINSNNCATFALNALSVAGFNLPRTSGTWINGGGLNPGDLGEDIREMTLSSNMRRSTVYGTHPNKGECY